MTRLRASVVMIAAVTGLVVSPVWAERMERDADDPLDDSEANINEGEHDVDEPGGTTGEWNKARDPIDDGGSHHNNADRNDNGVGDSHEHPDEADAN